MAATASLVNVDWSTIILALVSFLTTAYATYQKGVNTGTAKTTAAATATPAATSAQAAPVVVSLPVSSTATATPAPCPTSDIFDPAEHGGKGPNFWTWDQMKTMVLFRTSEVTRSNLLAGVIDQADRQKILAAIAAAEASNEYRYVIQYGHGYYIMQAQCIPIGTNQYKYTMVAESSGMDKQ